MNVLLGIRRDSLRASIVKPSKKNGNESRKEKKQI